MQLKRNTKNSARGKKSNRWKSMAGGLWRRTSDVAKILPGTVSLTICDCRPIRCTSHSPLYGYLRSSLRIVAERAPIALFISRLCQHCAHITRRTDPGCLSNNGRGLRSDHNRENSATTLEGRLDRGGIRSIYEFSRLTLVLGPSKNGSWFMYGCGPHDVAWIKETRHVFVSFDRLSCSDYAFMDAYWIRYVKDLLILSNFIARFHRFRRWEFVVQFRVWGIEIKMFFPLLLFRL